VLYLTHKGIEKIENLEVRVLISICQPGAFHAPPPAAHGSERSVPPRCATANQAPPVPADPHCLQPYVGLRTLYLESNAISNIEGLDALANLRCLYLGKNLISSLQGLQALTQLEVLDVAHNRISSCCGLSTLISLRSLNMSCNRLSTAADLAELASCTRMVTLDLSCNTLCAEGVMEVLAGTPWQLALLKLQGNPLVGQME